MASGYLLRSSLRTWSAQLLLRLLQRLNLLLEVRDGRFHCIDELGDALLGELLDCVGNGFTRLRQLQNLEQEAQTQRRVVAERKEQFTGSWLAGVMARRNPNVAAVAQANKTARIVWALLAHDRNYDARYGVAI